MHFPLSSSRHSCKMLKSQNILNAELSASLLFVIIFFSWFCLILSCFRIVWKWYNALKYTRTKKCITSRKHFCVTSSEWFNKYFKFRVVEIFPEFYLMLIRHCNQNCKKNPADKRHWISWPLWIVVPLLWNFFRYVVFSERVKKKLGRGPKKEKFDWGLKKQKRKFGRGCQTLFRGKEDQTKIGCCG